MKKLIILILLSIFVFNFAGFAFFFRVEQSVIRHSRAERIKIEEDIERIALTREMSEKYLWDDGKELKIGDKMYDIARYEDTGDSIIYYAVFDNEESHLLAKLETFFNPENTKHHDGKLELRFVQFLTLVTLLPSVQTADKTEILLTSITDITHQFTSIKLQPDTLPPRRV